MKWDNHIAIATAITLPFNPVMLPFSIIGSTAPDWLEYVANALNTKYGLVKHRTVTHILLNWLILTILMFVLSIFAGTIFTSLMWFAIGGLSHVIADMFSGNGVPVTYWSRRPSHLFGARIQYASSSEYILAYGMLIASILISYQLHAVHGFFPFFYDWSGLYNDGVIDGYEWKKVRFNII